MVSPRDMIARIEADYRLTAPQTGRSAPSTAVRAAMRQVPRHAFVRAEDRALAHEDRPLPIGHGQTISQPYIVALMADLIDVEPYARVLEVGTGCGYAAAVLSHLAREVYTVECIEALATEAAARLSRLGYRSVHVRHGDGALGWPEAAPFDGIVVSAACARIPDALVAQLAAPGVMVLPLGPPGGEQTLMRIRKDADGRVHEEPVLPVAFVPLVPVDQA